MSEAPGITESIARFAVGADVGAGPAELRQQALRAVIDTVGVSVAAGNEDCVRVAAATLTGELAPGDSTVLTTGRRTSAMGAALLNGVAGHALDYDDVTQPVIGHTSVALVPALLAVAEERHASGRELLDAYVVGYQVMCAVAAGLNIRAHYAKGWHSTATVGCLAATAGVARLLGLDVDKTRHALGMAASMAGGSRQNFGTMTKPLHPGLVGRDAVLAAKLAGNGFTADPSQLEAPLGYFAMFAVDGDPAKVVDTLERRWALLEDGINVKKYPCCYNTHRTADATLALAPKLHAALDTVTGVQVTVEPGGDAPLIRHRPVTGLEAKFSAEYVVAAALLDGQISLSSFTDAAVRRPEAQRLLRKVAITGSATPPFGDATFGWGYSVVAVHTGDGVVHERVDVPRGDARLPLSDEELDAKFRDCVGFAGGNVDGEALLAEVRALGEAPSLDGFRSLPASS